MHATRVVLLVVAWVFLFAVGCKKDAVDTMAFKSALNSYYAKQQRCLFTAPVKFPAQADTSKDEDTKTYDALTPGGTIAIAEILVNAGRTGPLPALIFAVNMLVNSNHGDTFSLAEIREWLREAGFEDIRTVDAPGMAPLLILATKPH